MNISLKQGPPVTVIVKVSVPICTPNIFIPFLYHLSSLGGIKAVTHNRQPQTINEVSVPPSDS